jgi:hypothetical protein
MPDEDWAVQANLTIYFNLFENHDVIWFLFAVSGNLQQAKLLVFGVHC